VVGWLGDGGDVEGGGCRCRDRDGGWEVVRGLRIGVVVVVLVVVVLVLGCSSASRHQARVLHLEVNYRQIFD